MSKYNRRAFLFATTMFALPALTAIAVAGGYADEPRVSIALRYRDPSHSCPGGTVVVTIKGPGKPAGVYNVAQPSGMRFGYCTPGTYDVRGTYRDPRTGRTLVASDRITVNSRGGSGLLVFKP